MSGEQKESRTGREGEAARAAELLGVGEQGTAWAPSAACPSEPEARARGSGVDHLSSSGPSTWEPSRMSMALS